MLASIPVSASNWPSSDRMPSTTGCSGTSTVTSVPAKRCQSKSCASAADPPATSQATPLTTVVTPRTARIPRLPFFVTQVPGHTIAARQ